MNLVKKSLRPRYRWVLVKGDSLEKLSPSCLYPLDIRCNIHGPGYKLYKILRREELHFFKLIYRIGIKDKLEFIIKVSGTYPFRNGRS